MKRVGVKSPPVLCCRPFSTEETVACYTKTQNTSEPPAKVWSPHLFPSYSHELLSTEGAFFFCLCFDDPLSKICCNSSEHFGPRLTYLIPDSTNQ